MKNPKLELLAKQNLARLLLQNFQLTTRPTACVTGAGASVDSIWKQEKLEARKILENAAESPASSARFVGQPAVMQT